VKPAPLTASATPTVTIPTAAMSAIAATLRTSHLFLGLMIDAPQLGEWIA
jgi:hypothetical protein